MHQSQWPEAVVKLSEVDEFVVDTCTAFRVASNAGAYGHLADARTDIMTAKGLGSISKWVDDYVFFRIPIKHAQAYNELRKTWRERILEQ